jgi:hypothetical protein
VGEARGKVERAINTNRADGAGGHTKLALQTRVVFDRHAGLASAIWGAG